MKNVECADEEMFSLIEIPTRVCIDVKFMSFAVGVAFNKINERVYVL